MLSRTTRNMPERSGRQLLSGLEHLNAAGLRRSTMLMLIDAVAAIGFAGGLAGAVAAIDGSMRRNALAWLALAAVAAAARGLVAWGGMRYGAEVSGSARSSLRQRVVRGAMARPGLAGTGGRLMQLAVDEVDALDGYLARFVPARRAACLAPLMILCAIACASLVTAAILLGTIVPFIVLMAFAGAASAGESSRQFEALSRLSSVFADRLRALPVVLAFRAEERQAALLNDAAQGVASRTLRVLRLAFLSSAVLEFFSALCVALVAVYCGFQLLGLMPFSIPERLDLSRAFFVLNLAPEFYAPMRRLAAGYHDRQAAATSAGRLLPLLAGPLPAGKIDTLPAAPLVRFEHVSIRFPGRPDPAVHDLTFELPAGRTVALLGPSGSGKSSVLRLLLGAAPLSEGRVFIEDRSLENGEGVAAHAAWVGQSTLIIPGTLARNLALACPGASQAQMADAMRSVGLEGLLTRRGGLQAPINARGSGLSGGERRRLALARAMLKPSMVWLLDEPTAHLDPASEADLIAFIDSNRRGRTTLIATHSEKLAAIADMVIRLERTA